MAVGSSEKTTATSALFPCLACCYFKEGSLSFPRPCQCLTGRKLAQALAVEQEPVAKPTQGALYCLYYDSFCGRDTGLPLMVAI